MQDAAPEPVEIPHAALSAAALRGLIEEFVTRDGTDYGVRESSLEDRVRTVMRQLERGDAKVVFDPETQTANIVVDRRR